MPKRATRGQIFGSLGLLALVVLAGAWWWQHVYWAFQIARHGVRIPAVKVSPMQPPGKAGEWTKCRLGPMSFKLPVGIVDESERTTDKAVVVLTAGDLEIRIDVPSRTPPNTLTAVSATVNQPPMQLLADSYRASTDQFRWTMSHDELRRHRLLVNMASLFPHAGAHGPGAAEVETRFDKDIEGLLIIYDGKHANFEWRTTSDAGAGFIMFASKDEPLDLDFVRDVCQSVTCDESQLGPRFDKKELQQMLDAMETTRVE